MLEQLSSLVTLNTLCNELFALNKLKSLQLLPLSNYDSMTLLAEISNFLSLSGPKLQVIVPISFVLGPECIKGL